ncbi:HNH endonuclease signature motif containing protein [Fibrella aquatilis]|uniref:HNH endonuclease n=1 Tax=Fibrella aquatilis TaxID=2817059 RepID=A0A939G1V6_9BACT|nr:HNH endonuclease signature motif containing protein [Fibrella aquatilis]MBO0930331.1 HNH endonuclease [Fibrella aquatilis]
MTLKEKKPLAWRVFQKGEPIPGKNPDLHRLDAYGTLIYWPHHGKPWEMGWEIDHRKPLSKGGSNNIRNLQPTHWKTNRQKGATYPFGIESVDPLPVSRLLKPARKRK